jgi:hypothetical protein
MKFTLPKRALVKLLKIVTTTPGDPRVGKDQYLRIEARGATLTMTANEAEVAAPAEIAKEGVCYIRYRNLLPVIQSFKGVKELTIEIAPAGLQIGTFRVSDGIWIALFDNPATAPRSLIRRDDPRLAAKAEAALQEGVQAWRDFYAGS